MNWLKRAAVLLLVLGRVNCNVVAGGIQADTTTPSPRSGVNSTTVAIPTKHDKNTILHRSGTIVPLDSFMERNGIMYVNDESI